MNGSLTAKTSKEKMAEQGYGRVRGYAQRSASAGSHCDILDLQRSAGNQAVNQALKSSATNPGPIQGKLTISQPGDKFEQEADRVANQVMGMPDSDVSGDTQSVTPIRTQSVQRDAPLGHAPTVTPSVQAKIEGLQRSGGEPLPKGVRSFMEPKFGKDLSHVRVHTGSYAEKVSNSLSARALTLGNCIVFNAGQFQPNTKNGLRLLAHELGHESQQASQNSQAVQRVPIETGAELSLFDAIVEGKINDGATLARRLRALDVTARSELLNDLREYFRNARSSNSELDVVGTAISFIEDIELNLKEQPRQKRTKATKVQQRREKSEQEKAAEAQRKQAEKDLEIFPLIGSRRGVELNIEKIERRITVIEEQTSLSSEPGRFEELERLRDEHASLKFELQRPEETLGSAEEFRGIVEPVLQKVGRFLEERDILTVERELKRLLKEQHEREFIKQLDIPPPELKRRYLPLLETAAKASKVFLELILLFDPGIRDVFEFTTGTSILGEKLTTGERKLAGVGAGLTALPFLSKALRGMRLARRILGAGRNGAIAILQISRKAKMDPFKVLELVKNLNSLRREEKVIQEALVLLEKGRPLTGKHQRALKNLVDALEEIGPGVKKGKGSVSSGTQAAKTKGATPSSSTTRKPVSDTTVSKKDTSTGTKRPKTIEERFGKQVSPEEVVGFTKAQREVAKRLFTGKALTQSESTKRLADIWRSVAKPGQESILTKSNSRRLFDNQRGRFWRKVRKDPDAVRMFEEMGAKFPKNPTTVPVLRLPNGKETRITIDHIVERQTAPGRALDPSNLRFSTTKENTVLLRQITEQDPFQRVP